MSKEEADYCETIWDTIVAAYLQEENYVRLPKKLSQTLRSKHAAGRRPRETLIKFFSLHCLMF